MKILKKAVAVTFIILVILASSVAIAVTKTKGKVVTETLRLRKEASLESTVLELLSKDDEVEIIAEEGDWYKVNFKTYTGYVSKEYISKMMIQKVIQILNKRKIKTKKTIMKIQIIQLMKIAKMINI